MIDVAARHVAATQFDAMLWHIGSLCSATPRNCRELCRATRRARASDKLCQASDKPILEPLTGLSKRVGCLNTRGVPVRFFSAGSGAGYFRPKNRRFWFRYRFFQPRQFSVVSIRGCGRDVINACAR